MIASLIYPIVGGAALYSVALAALFSLQRRLLYFPLKTDADPASLGLPEAEVRHLATSDGETLVAWFVRGTGSKVVLYFHGKVDPLASRVDRIRQLVSQGLSVLAVDYRGFGGSTGVPTQAGLHRDADATYDEAIRLGFVPDDILLLGESLGSGVSLELATRRPVAGVMLDSPYSSIVDVAAARYRLFPVRRLMRDQFRSDRWIANVDVPILILHGTGDWVVPYRFGCRLAALGGENVSFFPIEAVAHVVFGFPVADQHTRAWLTQFGIGDAGGSGALPAV